MGANRGSKVYSSYQNIDYCLPYLCFTKVVCYLTLIAKSMQDSNYDYNCNSECKDAMRDFVTQGYKEKLLPLPVSLTTPHYWLAPNFISDFCF
jgi:hypothetical protein